MIEGAFLAAWFVLYAGIIVVAMICLIATMIWRLTVNNFFLGGIFTIFAFAVGHVLYKILM